MQYFVYRDRTLSGSDACYVGFCPAFYLLVGFIDYFSDFPPAFFRFR